MVSEGGRPWCRGRSEFADRRVFSRGGWECIKFGAPIRWPDSLELGDLEVRTNPLDSRKSAEGSRTLTPFCESSSWAPKVVANRRFAP